MVVLVVQHDIEQHFVVLVVGWRVDRTRQLLHGQAVFFLIDQFL